MSVTASTRRKHAGQSFDVQGSAPAVEEKLSFARPRLFYLHRLAYQHVRFCLIPQAP